MVEEPQGGGSGAGWPGTCRRAGPPEAHVAEAGSVGRAHVAVARPAGGTCRWRRLGVRSRSSGWDRDVRHTSWRENATRPKRARQWSAGLRPASPAQRAKLQGFLPPDGALAKGTARRQLRARTSLRRLRFGFPRRGRSFAACGRDAGRRPPPGGLASVPLPRAYMSLERCRLTGHMSLERILRDAHVADAGSADESHVAVAGPPGGTCRWSGIGWRVTCRSSPSCGGTCRWSEVGWRVTCRSSRSCGRYMSLRRDRRAGHMSQ